MTHQIQIAAKSGTFTIGGELKVNRLGYGTMQLTGDGVWGEPNNPEEAVRVLQKAIELGVNFIDTADAYGPFVTNKLIKKALHPYNEDLVIATKVGLTRAGPNDWRPVGRPEYLRQQVEINRNDLGVDTIDLLQLHRIDPQVPLADQIGELKKMKEEGKIRHIGLSQVSVEELKEANEITPIASVQNMYNLANRESEAMLEYCEENNIAFIPWFPLATGELAKEGGPLDKLAKEHDAQPAQLALAWLLKRSKVILPIPGTSSVSHLEDNLAAAEIELSDEEFKTLSDAVTATK
ncbi:aldo/keto reductase [Aquibacillus rhizosphaerae]|uniref:Aldo/keto reductase n=1 Tax=Aquibacillus rhizosphaerae TaxID=3051431 RepID=A0ABT7LAY7_9BACI|nr:aldo/keto reductase [Aquibacillus sp. LR5S19]MDL4841720.1 aldo/keto reductase [Aquibacillus sp. LR5S19]